MKKKLLCLFLLMSLSFYSQVANEVHCAGETTFNLTNHNSLLIGNLNPTGTTVSYHLSAADASNGVNAISNPTNFIVPQIQANLLASQTIHARINHLENITTNYFSLIVNPHFLAAARIEPINCYSNGAIILDVFGGQAPYFCIINGSPSTYNFLYGPVSRLEIPNLVAGTYNIEIRDAIGCITHGSWTIEPSSIIPLNTPTAAVINATCKGSNNGALNINATGGKSPLSYSIDNGATYVLTNTFTNLAAGNYTVYVKDASNCIKTTNASVTEPNLLQMSAVITKPIDCISNATITIAATGGSATYTYSKDGVTFVQSNVFDNLVAGTYSTYVKDANGCVKSSNSIIISPLLPLSISSTAVNINCKGDASGSITANIINGFAPYTYSLDNGPFVNGNSNIVFINLFAGTHSITVKDTNGCLTTTQVIISEPISALMAVTTVKNQTITINATGGTGNYRYAISPNLDKFSTNNIFSGLTPGSYIVDTSDMNGCYITMNAVVDPLAPLINGQIKLTLEFKPGQTLADLIIDGQNIKWYINQNPLAGKTSKTSEVALPLSTVIVDGTTYYATQTVNGIESIERLAVTVKSSTLGIDELAFKNFSFYPNPVKNSISISNDSVIDEVTFISIKGETILTQKLNSLSSEIDLSNLSTGVYFLKVKSGEVKKIVKIIKN